MHSNLKVAEAVSPRQMPEQFVGIITGVEPQCQHYVIDGVFLAQKALGLFLHPEVGDTVCFVLIEQTREQASKQQQGSKVPKDQEYIILQVLTRSCEQLPLTLQTQQKVQWIAPEYSVKSLGNLELTALNKVSLSGKQLLQNALDTLLQQAENLLQHSQHFSANARGLMQFSSKQKIITADEDIKIDGERINLG